MIVIVIMSKLKKIRGTHLFLTILLFCLGTVCGNAQSDTLRETLSFAEFLERVKEHHPIAMQANLQLEMGDAEVLSARGSFDPQLYADIAQKYFKGDQYYSLMNGGLKIPTWFGVEFYAGYENNRGANINPQYFTPDAGLAYAGVSVPLGQGLLMDKRRAQLRKAQIYQQMSREERRIILNDLLLEASDAYWLWFEAYHKLSVYNQALDLVEVRLNAVRRAAELGDIAFIDTLEAGIQYQNRQILVQQSEIELFNAQALLSVYIWQAGVIPLEVGDSIIPPKVENIAEETPFIAPPQNVQEALDQHPEIAQTKLKIDQLNIERRLSLEFVKPQLNLKYNAINQPVGNNPFTDYTMRNYTWGADFSIPLFLRYGRGELKLANLYIQDATLGLETKKAVVNMKANQAANEWSLLNRQVELYNRTVVDMERLLQGEQTKFQAGESSLFMVNARETSYISAQIKLLELTAKNQRVLVKTYHSIGVLGD